MGNLVTFFPFLTTDESWAQGQFEGMIRGHDGLSMFEIERWAQVCRMAYLWWRKRLRMAARDDIAALLLNLPDKQRLDDSNTLTSIVASIDEQRQVGNYLVYSAPDGGGLLLWSNNPRFNNVDACYRLDELVSYHSLLPSGAAVKPLLSFSRIVKQHINLAAQALRHERGWVAFPRWDDVVRWALRPRNPPPIDFMTMIIEETEEPPAKKARLS